MPAKDVPTRRTLSLPAEGLSSGRGFRSPSCRSVPCEHFVLGAACVKRKASPCDSDWLARPFGAGENRVGFSPDLHLEFHLNRCHCNMGASGWCLSGFSCSFQSSDLLFLPVLSRCLYRWQLSGKFHRAEERLAGQGAGVRHVQPSDGLWHTAEPLGALCAGERGPRLALRDVGGIPVLRGLGEPAFPLIKGEVLRPSGWSTGSGSGPAPT